MKCNTNKSSGFNVGVAIAFQNGVSAGITAGANVAKGYGNGDSQAWVGSQIGSRTGKTEIESGETVNIKGSQVLGHKVNLVADNLNIESLQDTARYKGKQMSASGQVTVGYGFSASGSFNQSKVNSDYASVKTQAGIFAGDGGYDIEVNKHTDLKGGLITSSDKAEAENRNRFSTGTLSHEDVGNHASHSANGFGLSGGVTVSGGEAPQELGGVKLLEVGQNHQDGGAKVELGGVAGVGSQGNWGIAKGLATALLGQVSDKGSDNSVTTSSINTRNIHIRDEQAQLELTGKTAEETAQAISQPNSHRTLAQADVEKIKSDLEQNLAISNEFVNKVSEIGDEIHYKAEKNEDSLFTIEKKSADCNHLSCLDFKKDNSQELKALIYGEEILTEEQAKRLSKIATAGMLNLDRESKTASAILYDKDLNSIDDTGVILNRGSAGLANEFIFTVFERLRAGANMPAIFGASNATRDHAQIAKKLEEYNAYAKQHNKPVYDLNQVAHSLGVSGNKNMLNWSEHLEQSYPNTKANFLHLGGSYPSEKIHTQAKNAFKEVSTEYSGVEGDFVYQGTPLLRNIGLGMIGNNPNAIPNKDLGFGEAHSDANQNINNLKFIYRTSNKRELEKWVETENILKNIHINGIKNINTVKEGNNEK
ncbi:hypothetical protein CVP05_10635 [Conservatibacter flavescens]|uniref:Hemagglutinin n=1 Tax=Conservatibacter flavescens TaxID=28161 RepID=A0A2M8S0E9_9PAST|nr:hemagglutinin repeat-containing protein [Conservatibacter flavescens]PJG84586.1 hypothetical protein CVP05_10635 [Conservatibacter flavescens]